MKETSILVMITFPDHMRVPPSVPVIEGPYVFNRVLMNPGWSWAFSSLLACPLAEIGKVSDKNTIGQKSMIGDMHIDFPLIPL